MMKKRIFAATLSTAALLSTLPGRLAFADEILKPGNDINCTNLTSPDETVERLRARYGSQARIEELRDTESEPFPGIALHPDDPHFRIESEPGDWDVKKTIAGINLTQKGSRWSMFGLRIGMPLADVTAANGEPLKLTGFWQHPDGSYSVFGDFRPDRLEGGCRLVVFLASPVPLEAADPLYGLGEIPSDNPDLMKRKPTVNGLFIVWRKPTE